MNKKMVMRSNVREVQVLNRSSGQHIQRPLFCSSLSIICYSIISSCSYWNSNTLDAVIENGTQQNSTMYNEHCVTSFTVPESVTIFGIKINLQVNEVSQARRNK